MVLDLGWRGSNEAGALRSFLNICNFSPALFCGLRIRDLGWKVWVWCLRFGIWGLGFGDWGLGLRVEGFRVARGVGFRFRGSGFRVKGEG